MFLFISYFQLFLLSNFTWTHVLVIPGETAIKFLIRICLMALSHVPGDKFTLH